MVRTFLTFLICGALVFAPLGSAIAVEKKAKEDKGKKEQPAKPGEKEKKSGAAKASGKKDSQASKAPKHFDTFVDQNGNGIDDRRENLKTKAVTKGSKKGEQGKATESRQQPDKKSAEKKSTEKKETKKDSDKQ